MKLPTSIITFALGITAMTSSCKKEEFPVEVPSCIRAKIRSFQKENVTDPPRSVMQWETTDGNFYTISEPCCDAFNFLYDEKCKEICAPSGGLNGQGDGTCPDYTILSTTLVWSDPR